MLSLGNIKLKDDDWCPKRLGRTSRA